ncbi:MAG: polysaccharide pyruvyl transferase family protein [Shinella sp.]|nr:polysaccharide pyruvyl transferase family protein [Shinella sp.]
MTGVLTFHKCINYGSYWQARCLVEGLRSFGVDAVILDHNSRRVDLQEWRCAFQPLLPARTARDDYPRYASKMRKFFDAFSRLPSSPSFPLEEPAEMEPVQIAVVGSDEVWNFRHPWYGGCPIFFGEGLKAGRVVSYGATFGNCTASHRLEGHWSARLGGFESISVRDRTSMQIVRDALGYEPRIVLDPCLLFPERIRSPHDAPTDRPYVAVYGHSFPEWFRTAVTGWARRNSSLVLSVGYRNDWADSQYIDAGPEEFAAVMAGAQSIATNFFHGCVFALVNERPFACALSSYRSNKIRDLLTLLGADRHIMAEADPCSAYEKTLGEPIDPAVGQRIAALRHSSAGYLKHAVL